MTDNLVRCLCINGTAPDGPYGHPITCPDCGGNGRLTATRFNDLLATSPKYRWVRLRERRQEAAA